jgi:hypothetical protein
VSSRLLLESSSWGVLTLINVIALYLSAKDKEGIDPLLFGDQQIASVCRDYYRDNSFCKNADGSINLWKLYNLFTGANKSTHIDQFLERSVSASVLVETIRDSLNNTRSSWYLN